MRHRLSTRLTIAAALSVFVAVLVLGVAASLLVSHRLHSSLDQSLRRRAIDVARLSVSAPAVLEHPGSLEAPVAGRQLSVEVLDRRGLIVARSLALGAKLLPEPPVVGAALHQGRTGFASVRVDGEPTRLFAAPIADAGGPASGGAVLVASSTRDIAQTRHGLDLLLALCGLGAAVLGAGAAAFLTRRGLRPLAQLSRSAASIERTGDSSTRLPEPPGGDEVGELARTLNRMLETLDRSRARERRMLADASHELRTPLTALAGNVEFITRHGSNPEVLADLRRDAERLRRLLDDLLALEREHGAGPPEHPVRIDELVGEVLSDHPGVEAPSMQPASVVGEPEALRRALENLIENAEIHGPAGGAVRVGVATSGADVEVSVSDEGSGIPPAQVERAFDRFWRGPAAGSRPGSGLGLPIVKATAERHGGSVSVAGATITLRLPALEGGPPGPPAPQGRRRRVLSG